MEFIDGDGNIVVPKAVRPLLDINETVLGSKKGAKRQYRYGKLHIRDYDTHYTVHMDKVDPIVNPLGHLLVDAPEYLAGAAAGMIIGREIVSAVYHRRKKEGKTTKEAAIDAALAGCIAGSAAGNLVFKATKSIKRRQ